MMNNLKGTIYDATPMILRQKDEDTTLIEQGIQDAWKQYWPIAVQSKSDTEFESNWKALQDALTGANIKAYTKTMEDNYKKNLSKLGK